MNERGAALLVLAALAVAGCKGKVRVLTESKQVDGTLTVSLSVEPATAGVLRFSGNRAFEKLGDVAVPTGGRVDVDVAIDSARPGKQTVDVKFEGKGRGLASSTSGSSTFTFEPVDPVVRLKFAAVPKEGALPVSCRGELCAAGTRLPITRDGLLSVKLTDCTGCTVEISGHSIEVEDDKETTIDLIKAITEADAKGLESLGYIGIPVKVTLPSGQAPEPPMLELLGSVPAAIVLTRVAKGPLAFPKDKDATTPRAAVIVREDVNINVNFGVVTQAGSAKRIRDFDLIGIAVATEQSLGPCGNVAHKGVSYAVTMYDRRTGKSLGKRTFGPENLACGDNLVSDVIVSMPAASEVATWAKTFLK
jgi:hypothetical protein